jgi:hypothetical protein
LIAVRKAKAARRDKVKPLTHQLDKSETRLVLPGRVAASLLMPRMDGGGT